MYFLPTTIPLPQKDPILRNFLDQADGEMIDVDDDDDSADEKIESSEDAHNSDSISGDESDNNDENNDGKDGKQWVKNERQSNSWSVATKCSQWLKVWAYWRRGARKIYEDDGKWRDSSLTYFRG